MSLLGCVVCVHRGISFVVKNIASPEYLHILERNGMQFVGVLTINRTGKDDFHKELLFHLGEKIALEIGVCL